MLAEAEGAAGMAGEPEVKLVRENGLCERGDGWTWTAGFGEDVFDQLLDSRLDDEHAAEFERADAENESAAGVGRVAHFRFAATIGTERLGEDKAVHSLTVIELKGFGKQRGHPEIYRGCEYTVDFLPKVMILIFTTDEAAPQIVETIIARARTGKTGDGMVIVSDIAHAFQVRTGESGEAAL